MRQCRTVWRSAWRRSVATAQPVLVPRAPAAHVLPPLDSASAVGRVYDATGALVPEAHADLREAAKAVLLRQTAADIADDESGASVLLDGPPGAGKSAQLLAIHALLAARGRKSVYVPSLRRVVSGAEPYVRRVPLGLDGGDNSISGGQPGHIGSHADRTPQCDSTPDFEMPGLAARLAAQMGAAHTDTEGAIAALPPGATILLDDANALFAAHTSYRDEGGKPLPAARFAVLASLRAAVSSGRVRVVGATHRTDAATSTGLSPEALGVWRRRVAVPALSAAEVRALLAAHAAAGRVVVAALSRHYVARMRLATSGLPGRLLPTSDYDAVYSPAGPRGISRR